MPRFTTTKNSSHSLYLRRWTLRALTRNAFRFTSIWKKYIIAYNSFYLYTPTHHVAKDNLPKIVSQSVDASSSISNRCRPVFWNIRFGRCIIQFIMRFALRNKTKSCLAQSSSLQLRPATVVDNTKNNPPRNYIKIGLKRVRFSLWRWVCVRPMMFSNVNILKTL